MAKEKSNSKTKRSTKPWWQRAWTYFTCEQTRFVVGLLIILVAAYSGLAFVSFFLTGKADQSIVEHISLYDVPRLAGGVSNWMGVCGAWLAELAINRWIGVAALLFVLFFLRLGARLVRGVSIRSLGLSFVVTSLWAIWISLALGFFFVRWYGDSFLYLGGKHGYDFTRLLDTYVGWLGTLLIIIGTFVLLSLFVFSSTMRRTRAVLEAPSRWNDRRRQQRADRAAGGGDLADADADTSVETPAVVVGDEDLIVSPQPIPVASVDDTPDFIDDVDDVDTQQPVDDDMPDDSDAGDNDMLDMPEDDVPDEPNVTPDPTFTVQTNTTELVDAPVEQQEDYDPTADLSHYEKPGFELLREYNTGETPVDMAEQNENKEKIKNTLHDYGIEIQDIKAVVGPTITLFEIVLQSGTKIARVKSLSDEIAMSIASTSGIRIIAPIPGKSAIGIEVPNRDPQTVSMRECIQSRTFQESKMELPVVLGKTITNEVFMFDLAKAPHLLVAGATGQGKSVGLNAIITSLLYKKHPSQLKFVLVDPKMVEFSIYQPLERHFLAKIPDETDPIITDTTKVVATLNSIVLEMEDRYALVKDAGLRNIKEYNEMFVKHRLNPTKLIKCPTGSREGKCHQYLPYIVVIVDEYGDLIMTAGKEIELPIARIAQKARAVGIHMIIATQRPSAKIITGIIKANFPARIAFKVGAAIDSSIILDQTGAQKLIGRGDLLISMGSRFERVQCAFVDTPEVKAINDFISTQQAYPTAFILPEPPAGEGGGDDGGSAEVDLHQLDPLFDEAAELVVATGQGSTSMIQRKFSIGYNRAGRIMDQLEAAGIVGPYTGSKARAVIVDSEMQLQNILQGLRSS